MSAIEFRPCVIEDVHAAVPLIYASGPPAFEYVFQTSGKTAQGFLRMAFITPGGEFSFDNHFVGVSGKHIVAAGAIYDASRAGRFMWYDIRKIIRFYKLAGIPVLTRGWRTEQKIVPPMKNEICISHLGVDPAFRSRGYGQQLIKFLMDQVEQNNDSIFVLDVSEKNPRAQALYERMGFQVKEHRPSSLGNKYSYVPGHFRMELKANHNLRA